jgi:TonB family protein
MPAPAVYRIPRRFITFPDDPRPYGILAVSFLGHMLCFGGALALSAFLGSRIDQSRVYVVNLVPAAPSVGSPAPVDPPAPPAAKAPEAPRPAPPAPKAEVKAPPKAEVKAPPKAEEKAPPRPARPEPPPRTPERVVEPPPPRAPEVAVARPKSLEPSELALPRRVEKENPTLKAPETRVERSLPPPPPVTPATSAPAIPATPPRLPEPPRIAAPPAAPATPPAPVAAARPGVEPIRLGRPNAPSTSTGSIAVDASDFPFTYYLRLIQSKIGERWSPPRAAAAGGERVVVLFEIQRDGQIREPSVERSSGNTLYDQSALRAVTEASPFPPLPPEFKASSLRVHFGFEFQPGQGQS